MLKIKKIDNGYLLTDTGGGEVCVTAFVDGNDNECLADLLRGVAEGMGYQYNKWGDKNLTITFDGKGSKLC